MTVTVTTRGRVTLAAELRRRLGITVGTRLELLVTDDGKLLVIPLVGSLRQLKGMLLPPPKALSLEEMEQAIARGAAR